MGKQIKMRKRSYELINKMHDLERGRKANKIFSITQDDRPYILLCLTHIRICLFNSLDVISDEIAKVKIANFKQSIDVLLNEIKEKSTIRSIIEKGVVARVLTNHTDMYKYLRSKGIHIDYDLSEYDKAGLTAVAIWNNDKFLRKLI